jgi:hypothetical protein
LAIVRILSAAAGAIAVAAVALSATAGCSGGPDPSTGTVTGYLEMAGGPATLAGRTPSLRVPGTITAASPHDTQHGPAAKNGAFTLVLPAGTYTLTGTSPQYNSGQGQCIAAARVVIRAGVITRADVTCVMS